jgi:6-phosphofructokinase 1
MGGNKKKRKRIGVLTSGGDCPGLNAAIRGVAKSAMLSGMDVIGICSGFQGLINRDSFTFTEQHLSGLLTEGGTILKTSREKPFKNETENKPQMIMNNYSDLGLDCLVCIGGNGTMKTANRLREEGLNVIGMPKTIDNDVWGTDFSFGFFSAVDIATEAIDRIHTTANSHNRIMVVEVMGHSAGWLALYSGVAGGGDIILIPEIPYSVESIIKTIRNRHDAKKNYSIIVVAEGIEIPSAKKSRGRYIARQIEENTGLETRETILGYIQRGGSPSPMDRIIASRLGAYAAQLAIDGEYGKMAALRNWETTSILLSDVAGKLKTVDRKNEIISEARLIGTSFGD